MEPNVSVPAPVPVAPENATPSQTRMSPMHIVVIVAVSVFVAGVIGAFAYAYVRITALSAQVEHLNAELATTTAALAGTISALDLKASGLSDTLSSTTQQLQQSVSAVSSHVGSVEQVVGQVSGNVNTLQKLSQVDKELLQKYSKVFFLNENYKPDRVTDIPTQYLYNEEHPEVMHAIAWPHMQQMIDVAKMEGVTIYIKSAYRSFDEQKSLKSAYSVTYGAGSANQFSADQGYSEHQLGTAADFISTGQGGQLIGFEKTKAYTWLVNNAYKYGFALSYPKGNAYYMYEPWHWRYVGVKLATDLHNQGTYFYNLDQRAIDTYLVSFE